MVKNNLKLQKQKPHKTTPKIIIGLFSVLALSAITLAVVGNPSDAQARRYRHRNTTSSTSTQSAAGTTSSSSTPTTSTTSPVSTGSGATTPTTSPSSTTTTTNLPFASSLVGYWKLDGNTNGALGKDNGKVVGNVNYVAGKFGQAAHFDGKSYIEIPDQDYFSPSTTGEKMTVSFWFKPDTYNFPGINQGYVNFLGKSDFSNGAQSEWEFRLDNETAYDGFSRSERMNFYAFNQGGGLGAGSAINKACPLDVWTHVVGEVDGTNTRLYINGKLVDSDLLSDYAIKMSNTTTPLRLGTSDKESFLQGSLSNVMIFNRALSDSEVTQLFQTDLSK